MALILNIDTSTEQASLALSEDGQALCQLSNPDQKEHSSWLHPAIQNALERSGKKLADLTAVAVTAGPGSYTGLRVGMAAAKGLCFALQLPFIMVNTLEAMFYAAIAEEVTYICPMIDARRMEVFTALYDKKGNTLIPPCAMILEESSFTSWLDSGKVLFFGNGSEKWKKQTGHINAFFKQLPFSAVILGEISYKRFLDADFTPLAYAEPIYIKDFYTPGISG